jgi:hypothetical protein
MTTFVFANNVNTKLAGNVAPTDTTITLASTANLPASIPAGEYFVVTINDAATRQNFEVLYVTAITGATLTVLRAQEGTTALSWLVGDYVYSPPTAGQMQSFGAGGVTSFNTRTGPATLTSSDVTTALTYTPFDQAGGTIGGDTSVTGSVNVTSTFYAAGTSAILATGPTTTGVNGTVYLKPNGRASTVGQTTVNGSGVLTANPTGAAPTTGVSTFGVVSDGAFGGGMGMVNGSATWGWWVDASNSLVFGYSATGGALTAVAKFTNTGNFVALGTIQGGTAP